MILGCGNTRASEDLHFPQAEATVHVHLVTLVLREIEETRQYYVYRSMRRGLVRRSQKEVRMPRAHFSVNEKTPDEKVVWGKKNAPLVDIDEPRANKWRLKAPRLYLSLPVPFFFHEPVHW